MKKFTIPINAEDESGLYGRFLPSGLSFSGDLVDYLTDCIEDRKPGEKICIELHASRQPDLKRFRNTYNAYVEKLIRRNKQETAKVDTQAIMFLLLGVASIVAGFILNDSEERILAEIFATGGSFALMGAIEAFLETLPTLRYKTRQLQQVALKADIRFKQEG